MRQTRRTKIRAVLVLAALVALATETSAQSSGGPYHIGSVVIAGGGGVLSGGGFQLRGSFGQPATDASSGAGYVVHAGFVGPADSVFHNGFEYE